MDNIDSFLEDELVSENIADLTESTRDSDYAGIDDLIDDVEENGVYQHDIFGIHENESVDDEDDFEMDCETALRKAIDVQFKENCYQ